MNEITSVRPESNAADAVTNIKSSLILLYNITNGKHKEPIEQRITWTKK